ncbi:hypothetical protein HDU93_003505 [Gonapodya sp. JEL0774]|nr:hypothetical protein HDU93_003505 [Gonapodya sp. JEL0774]
MTIRSAVLALALAIFMASSASAATCTIKSSTDVAGCLSSTDITIQGPFTVPKNAVIDMSGLKSGTKVTVKGTITWAAGTLDKSHYLFTIGGSGVTFDGTGATFDGNGASYWDGQGGNGGVPKPKMFRSTLTGTSVVKGIKILNAPVHVFSIGGSDTTFDSITVDDSAGKSLGHNTDAFDVSASNIIIKNSIVVNQDDCLAINSGSNIQFINNQCTGGHGISIGYVGAMSIFVGARQSSIASGKTVQNVLVQNCIVSSEDNGLRIKTIVDATGGFVKDIVWKNVTLKSINNYGIVIQQDYLNGGPTGNPGGGIPISNVTATGVTGTMASGAKANIYINCPLPPTVTPALVKAIKHAAGASMAATVGAHLPPPAVGVRLAAEAPELYKRVVAFASIPQTPINLDRMLRAGHSLTHKKILLSALFVHNELPIRLARRILELDSLPTKLLETESVRKLRESYIKSWMQATEFERFCYGGKEGEGMRIEYELGARPTDDFIPSLRFYHLSPDLHEITAPEDHVNKQGEFVKMLQAVKWRHRADPVFMSLGIYAYRRALPPSLSDAPPLQSFLQSFNRGRIGTRILMGHQIAMTRDFLDGKRREEGSRVGIIDRETDIGAVVREAWEGAGMVAKKFYGPALTSLPALTVRTPPDTPRPTFTYIPTILHHMLFELFKNSIRATVESCSDIRPLNAQSAPEETAERVARATDGPGKELKFPAVKVVIVGGKEDMIIKVSDEGGGIAREHLDRMGSYMFTTAPPVTLTHAQAVELSDQVAPAPPFDDVRYSLPLAGFGYGLPITRQYAEYLGGAVEVISMEGYGTDAFLYMNRLGDIVEQLSDDVVIAGGGMHGHSGTGQVAGEGAKAMSLY